MNVSFLFTFQMLTPSWYPLSQFLILFLPPFTLDVLFSMF